MKWLKDKKKKQPANHKTRTTIKKPHYAKYTKIIIPLVIVITESKEM
jgi:hypothetical protein